MYMYFYYGLYFYHLFSIFCVSLFCFLLKVFSPTFPPLLVIFILLVATLNILFLL